MNVFYIIFSLFSRTTLFTLKQHTLYPKLDKALCHVIHYIRIINYYVTTEQTFGNYTVKHDFVVLVVFL